MAVRERVDMILISRQLGHANMRVREERYAHYHPDYMGQASDHSSWMLQSILKRLSMRKKSGKTPLPIELIMFFMAGVTGL